MSHPSIDLSIRDNRGFTVFSIAMTTSNNKAAQAILNREPTAAEQVSYGKVIYFFLSFKGFFNPSNTAILAKRSTMRSSL